MKVIGYIALALILVIGGFCLCYFGFGDKLADLLISAKGFIH